MAAKSFENGVKVAGAQADGSAGPRAIASPSHFDIQISVHEY